MLGSKAFCSIFYWNNDYLGPSYARRAFEANCTSFSKELQLTQLKFPQFETFLQIYENEQKRNWMRNKLINTPNNPAKQCSFHVRFTMSY